MVILIEASLLDKELPEYQRTWRGSVRTRADELVSIAAYADGSLCATVTLTSTGNRDQNGNRVLQVGSPQQPASCRREGATLTFVDGHGRTLAGTLVFEPGATSLLPTLAPVPPHTGDGGVGIGVGESLAQAERPGGRNVASTALLLAVIAAGPAAAILRARRRPR